MGVDDKNKTPFTVLQNLQKCERYTGYGRGTPMQRTCACRKPKIRYA